MFQMELSGIFWSGTSSAGQLSWWQAGFQGVLVFLAIKTDEIVNMAQPQ